MKRIITGSIMASLLAMQPVPASAQAQDKVSIPEFADRICDAMIVYDTTGAGDLHEAFEMMILDYLDIDKARTPSYRITMRDFWNEHHEQMTCTSPAPGHISPQHLLKRVVEMQGTSSFFFRYFLADRQLNVNAVEIRDGRRETLVDYLDWAIFLPEAEQLYDVSALRRLRAFLIDHMGAKRAADLP